MRDDSSIASGEGGGERENPWFCEGNTSQSPVGANHRFGPGRRDPRDNIKPGRSALAWMSASPGGHRPRSRAPLGAVRAGLGHFLFVVSVVKRLRVTPWIPSPSWTGQPLYSPGRENPHPAHGCKAGHGQFRLHERIRPPGIGPLSRASHPLYLPVNIPGRVRLQRATSGQPVSEGWALPALGVRSRPAYWPASGAPRGPWSRAAPSPAR